MKPSPVREKSFQFAVKIVRLGNYLIQEKKEYILSKQIIRSGTSIGANVHEAQQGVSKADFMHKLSISQKETNETIYWLKLLNEVNLLPLDSYQTLISDCNELMAIITAILLTSKNSNNK